MGNILDETGEFAHSPCTAHGAPPKAVNAVRGGPSTFSTYRTGKFHIRVRLSSEAAELQLHNNRKNTDEHKCTGAENTERAPIGWSRGWGRCMQPHRAFRTSGDFVRIWKQGASSLI